MSRQPRRPARPTGGAQRRRSDDELTLGERAHAQRVPLGPVFVYLGAVLTGALGHLTDIAGVGWLFWALLGAGTAVIGTVTIGRMNDALHQLYAGVVLAASATMAGLIYVHTVAVVQPWTWLDGGLLPLGQTLGLGLLAMLILGLFWWASEGKRSQVRIEHDVRSWADIAGQFGMGKTTRANVVRQANGNETGSIRWPAGAYTVDQVRAKRSEFEGAMGLDQGTLRLIAHGRATNQLDYMALADDPQTEAVEWPGVGEAEVSVTEPTVIGLDETGAQVTLADYIPGYGTPHKLLGGSQGSGKSGGLNLHMAVNACRFDVTQWGMDFKGGIELMPWRGVLDFFTRDAQQAIEMVTAIEAVIEDRAIYMADVAGVRLWRPGAVQDPHGAGTDGPVLVVNVDEIKELLQSNSGGRTSKQLNDIEDRMVRAATQGRAVGVELITATQNPTLEALRSSQFRDRLNQRVCFRTENAAHEQYILPDRKVDAHLIPADRQGTAYILDQDKFTGLPVRYYYLDDPTVAAIAQARTGGTCPLDPVSAAAAARVSALYREQHGLADDGEPVRDRPVSAGREPVNAQASVVSDDDAADDVIPPHSGEGPDVSLDALFATHDRITAGPVHAPLTREDVTESEMDRAHRIAASREGGRRDRAMRLLREVGQTGASPKALYTAAGSPERSAPSTWLYDELLKPGQQVGEIERVEHGRWALTAVGAHAT